jgi:hypothetical protein
MRKYNITISIYYYSYKYSFINSIVIVISFDIRYIFTIRDIFNILRKIFI